MRKDGIADMKKIKCVLSLLLIVLLTACGNNGNTVAETAAEQVSTENTGSENAAEQVSSEKTAPETTAEQASSGADSLIHSHKKEHKYVHGEEGYYNLLEDGTEFELTGQISGTCWICASSCAMSTAYQKKHEGSIVFDQMALLNEIYDEDKDEGVFVSEGVDKGKIGGLAIFVMNELNQGFGDGLVLDGAISVKGWSSDQIREGIKEYGALYIGIPDSDSSKQGEHDGYFTMNTPDPKESEFDHSIAVIGWDDHFPKEYFRVEASRDGAWITYNSSYPLGYYYVSYDTPFDQKNDIPMFLSVTDRYKKVLSHDCGLWVTDPLITGDVTTTASVFKGKGTLSAVGTYSLRDDQDLTISILSSDLSECLYSQKSHIDRTGYHVIELEEPQEVDEYAISVSYPGGAPVEGESMDLTNTERLKVTSDRGQSFIQLDGKWLDMSEKPTWDRCGMVTNNACIKALYTE